MIDLMTIKEVAEILHKPESTVRTWKRNGDIPADCFKKIGGCVFVRTNKINEWIENDS